jgi:hypothetical protein
MLARRSISALYCALRCIASFAFKH